MSNAEKPAVGTIAGFDLTVPDAEPIRDFYAAVIGWRPEPFDMGGYSDFFMKAPGSGEIVAGVCYARGVNADLPPQWLSYVVVADLDAALQRCTEHGGSQIGGVRGGGETARYAVIRDPAGAALALIEA